MFFTFNQNNSGGYFVEDQKNGVCEHIIIEADSADCADYRLGKIGEKVSGFFDYCNCCGPRWFPADYDDGTEEPEIYGTSVHDVKAGCFSNSCFIHCNDGRIVKVEFKKN